MLLTMRAHSACPLPIPKWRSAVVTTLPAPPSALPLVYSDISNCQSMAVTTVVGNLDAGNLAAAVSARERNDERAISRNPAPATTEISVRRRAGSKGVGVNALVVGLKSSVVSGSSPAISARVHAPRQLRHPVQLDEEARPSLTRLHPGSGALRCSLSDPLCCLAMGARMTRAIRLAGEALSCLLLGSCGAVAREPCTITAAVIPASATADHRLPPPGNLVQFSAASTVTGNCPLMPDHMGSWSTSDAVNTSISNQPSTRGLAMCLDATPTPATVAYSGTVRGRAFTPATLTCK